MQNKNMRGKMVHGIHVYVQFSMHMNEYTCLSWFNIALVYGYGEQQREKANMKHGVC